jgi:hypothetical protein
MLWQKNKNEGHIPHFLIEIEVASDSDPLFSFLLRVPYNVRFLYSSIQGHLATPPR